MCFWFRIGAFGVIGAVFGGLDGCSGGYGGLSGFDRVVWRFYREKRGC